ncbi:heterokaryon incompatibility protein-domain-containing protein [Fusarium oxysporum II5]|nr:uncharacterized protein FOIG_04631 [Fusarium odoratissimum NRRL 54006]EXM04410.1 hypothetical protein FOIG_04631 [Fusarium odoratissimum NRRL 54006]KAK2126505.1 heterokaryon incompatibility protein-domain-containing protein [Fusarium oxysporum II5]TXB98206.1 hypothetical protein FocTR4_00012348 [Fusarium oxysporum f. sp. cubense]
MPTNKLARSSKDRAELVARLNRLNSAEIQLFSNQALAEIGRRMEALLNQAVQDYQYKRLRIGEIRLLTLMPDEENHWLRCRLTHVHLHVEENRLPSFKALSYCWGPEDPKYPIEIFHESKCEKRLHGRKLSISENLNRALKQLRSEIEEVVIWADQICINQNDDDEKTSQVMLMRDIYQKASSTVIWLGPAADNSAEALNLIPKLLQARERDEQEGIQTNLLATGGERRGLPAPHSQVWYDLFAVLKRDWFYRAWIVQEVSVSPHATVLCGDMELSWSDIVKAIQYLADAVLGLTLGLQAFNQLHNLDYLRRCYLQGQTIDPLQLLVQTRRARAKQAEDHIFAFHGFYRNAESFEFNLTLPKYPVDYDVVYVQTANKMLRHYQTLDILSVHHIGMYIPPPDSRPLPSWVPDWSEGDTCEAFIWRNIHPEFTQEQRARYRASGSSRYHEFRRDDDRILKVEGWKVDEVLCTGLVMNPRYDHGVIDDITAQMSDILNTQETCMSWDVVARWHISQAYVTGEPPWAAYKATLLGGCFFEDEDDNLTVMFWLWRISLVPFKILHFLRLNRVWVLKTIFYCVAASTWFMQPVFWFIPFPGQLIDSLLPALQVFPKLASLIVRRRVIRTDQGLIGLAPAQTLPGDIIALCRGGKLPLILRPSGEGWQLVGDAYIHGLVDGLLWEMLEELSEREGPLWDLYSNHVVKQDFKIM